MKKRILALALALSVILLCFTACGGNKASDGNITDGNATNGNIAEDDYLYHTIANEEDEKGEPLFDDFVTTSIDGKEYTQEIFTGNKLTMVNIWGTFCSPCINEMPDLEKLSKDYADKGLVVVGIVSDVFDYVKSENSEAKIADAEAIIEQTGVTYVNLLPSVTLNKAKLNYITTFPTTYFLDENGAIIRSEYIGSRSYDQWAMIIDSMLEA